PRPERQQVAAAGAPEVVEGTSALAIPAPLPLLPGPQATAPATRTMPQMMARLKEEGRGQAPEKVTATDLFYLRSMDEGKAVNVPYLLAQYLFRHAEGRKCGARMSGGHFVGRLAEHFGLVTEEGLWGLTVVVGELRVINMDELARLRICERLGDTWAWVAPRPERQQVAAAGAPEVVEGTSALAVPAPLPLPPGPQATAPATRTMPQMIVRLKEEVHRFRESLEGQREVLDAMSQDFSRFTTWTVGRLSQLLDERGDIC
nr:hypothetical protein [Tanacetum cinerariifolium]